MPAVRRQSATQEPAQGAGTTGGGPRVEACEAAIAAATQAPVRRRTKAAHSRPFFTFDALPGHLKDNPHILGRYRSGYGFRQSARSLFWVHNETGNIWTHLVGFLIFLGLTTATFYLKPQPLRLGADALLRLEEQLYAVGKSNLFELLQTVEAWEDKVVKYGASGLGKLEGAVEAALAGYGVHNLSELRDALSHNLATAGAAGLSGLGEVGGRLRDYGRTGVAELREVEDKIWAAGKGAVVDAEAAVARALAALLNSEWPATRWPVHVFTAGAMLCMLTSSVCHLFGCCAPHVSSMMWRFDYAGIAILIVASFFPPVYYAFLCHPLLRSFYLLITTLMGLSTLCVTLLSTFQTPDFQAYRAGVFCALGLWGLVPVLHGWALNWGVAAVARALALDLLMGAIYLVGAVIYAMRIPERWKPGAFDLAFHSHQLFHVAVVVAACVHYRATRILLDWRDSTGMCS